MALFYCPDILERPVLSEEESQHCVKVLRKKAGDELDLLDGKGNFYKAQITDAHHKHCGFEVVEVTKDNSGPFNAFIAMCPTKNPERVEWFIEKSTEIGIGGFSFIRSQFSERKTIKTERIERIIVSALKQSVKALKPQLNELTGFSDFVKKPFEGQKYICHCQPGPKPLLNNLCTGGEPVLVLIGPEGDFSPEEVALAESLGYISVSLGDTRLRTETAAFVAAHIVQLKNLV